MPVDWSKYPENWKEVRRRILLRAGGGEEDPRIGARCEWCSAENWKAHPVTGSKVVLTVAHLADKNPMNVEDSNLAALCQRCHNRYDMEDRQSNAKKTRARKKREAAKKAGQMRLI